MKVSGAYEPKFERDHYRVNVVTAERAGPVPKRPIKLSVGGQDRTRRRRGRRTGQRPRHALRKRSLRLSALAEMHLADYKVRVINSAEGTAARVRVVIESRDANDVWTTVGVSENVIEASWLALVDSVEYKLYKDAGGLGKRHASAKPARPV